MRKRLVYCVYSCFLSFRYFFFLLQDSLFYHFLFVWRTSFGHFIKVKSVSYKFFWSSFIWECFSLPIIAKGYVLLGIKFIVDRFLLSELEKYHSFHGFRLEICCHLDWHSLINNGSFLSGCLQDFFSVVNFQKFICDVS